MSFKNFNWKFLFVLAGALLVLACVTLTSSAPVTYAPANTLAPTNTPRSTNTSLPPTATEVPPTPTPAPIGAPVVYDSLEITVLDVKNRESVHFGDVSGAWETFYKPLQGKFLIDVGVLVHNLIPGQAVHMQWKNVFVVEANGDSWYPGWGNIKTVSVDKKLDPYNIGLSSTQINGDDNIEFDNNAYLRLIFSVAADPEQDILFAINKSPVITFRVSK